jgi:potassium efflux system protein
MKNVARVHEHVVDDPEPFGDNALTLRAFVGSIEYRLSTITELNRNINHKLTKAGIVIAFPQRDVHLDTQGPLRARIDKAGENG